MISKLKRSKKKTTIFFYVNKKTKTKQKNPISKTKQQQKSQNTKTSLLDDDNIILSVCETAFPISTFNFKNKKLHELGSI